VLLCGYQSFIIDDVAWYQLPLNGQQPTCTLAHRVVRRGRALAVRCNFTGALTLRLRRGGRTRVRAVKLDAAGKGRVSTGGLATGLYRLSIRSGALAVRVGRSATLRVR
jgi:hypothetical protein